MHTRWSANRSAFSCALLCLAIGCGPEEAPFQSSRRVLDLEIYDTVKAAGSDRRSARFERDHLKSLVDTASKSFREERIEKDFKELALDPARLRIVERTPVRVYFIGEASGATNTLGINLSGIGVDEGDPKILFPNASCTIGLHSTISHFDDADGTLNRAAFKERKEGVPLQPGDFIDLGTLSAGTMLEFLLISTAGTRSLHTYTPHPENNHDGEQHMVAVVDETSGILLISFEDLPNLGDKDFGDLVFAVELSGYNVQAMLGKIDPWRRIKQLALIGGVVTLAIGTPAGLTAGRRIRRQRRALRARSEATKLAQKNVEAALARVKDALQTPMDRASRRALVDLECTLLEDVGDGASLAAVVERDADAVYDRERASLLAGRALLTAENPDGYELARDRWREDNTFERRWQELDADALLARGDGADVESALYGQTLTTKDDAGLLARLAVATARHTIERASDLANEAVALAPKNAEVHLARARIQEKSGTLKEAERSLARALGLTPRDPAIRLEVGAYFRRRGAYAKAIAVWATGLKRPSNADIWLQTLFWRKVAHPVRIDLTGLALPEGRLRPLIEFLCALPENELWNSAKFEEIAGAYPDLTARQEVFWLRLLEALRNRDEKTALYLLNVQRFGTESWCRNLEVALTLITSYRSAGFMDPNAATGGSKDEVAGGHAFFIQLNQWARGEMKVVPDDLRKTVEGGTAFAAACSAAGWKAASEALRRNAAP